MDVRAAAGSPEDQAIRHINAINHINGELRHALNERKNPNAVTTIISELHDHINNLVELKTKLKSFKVQLGIPMLHDAFQALLATPTQENLSTFARESYQIGSFLDVPGCKVATDVEGMKVAAYALLKAVRATDRASANTHMNLLQISMDNLLAQEPPKNLSDPIRQLNQNFLILESKFPKPLPEDVAEFSKALNEFPPISGTYHAA